MLALWRNRCCLVAASSLAFPPPRRTGCSQWSVTTSLLVRNCGRPNASTRKAYLSSSSSSSSSSSLQDLLKQVAQGNLSPQDAVTQIQVTKQHRHRHHQRLKSTNLVDSFAQIDHGRSKRTGFPEVVFAQDKTAEQVCAILNDMAQHNHQLQQLQQQQEQNKQAFQPLSAILATRVTPQQFDEMSRLPPPQHGKLVYNAQSRVVQLIPSQNTESNSEEPSSSSQQQQQQQQPVHRIVVVTAGTTDIPVAEEAAAVLEACSGNPAIVVDRVYDAGVAGLHRIVKALPRLRDPSVRCVIVCAGMDGALPSVVGGLVSTPVIAVPTSVGYGASFHGVSALLTMLNTCSPGVGVVNIDNGFGAAAWAYKLIHSSSSSSSSMTFAASPAGSD
ncbi:hypothetical protein ACA910_018853 [Epithemia clementina (nom. ined.)]